MCGRGGVRGNNGKCRCTHSRKRGTSGGLESGVRRKGATCDKNAKNLEVFGSCCCYIFFLIHFYKMYVLIDVFGVVFVCVCLFVCLFLFVLLVVASSFFVFFCILFLFVSRVFVCFLGGGKGKEVGGRRRGHIIFFLFFCLRVWGCGSMGACWDTTGARICCPIAMSTPLLGTPKKKKSMEPEGKKKSEKKKPALENLCTRWFGET